MKAFMKSRVIGSSGKPVVFLCQGPSEDESYPTMEAAQEACDRSNALYSNEPNPEWVYFVDTKRYAQ